MFRLFHAYVLPTCLGDTSQHAFQIGVNLVVCNTKHSKAIARESLIAGHVVFSLIGFRMDAAINFYDEMGFMTVEIGDESSKRLLAPKMQPIELVAA